MDPPLASDLLTEAGMLSVEIDGTRVNLPALSNSDIAYVRNSRQKNSAMQLAKKYVKANDAMSDLATALDVFPSALRSQAAVTNQHANPAAGDIVPFVPLIQPAPLAKAAAAKRQEMGYSFFNLKVFFARLRRTQIVRLYITAITWSCYIMLLLPIVVLAIYVFYAISLSAYLCLNPAAPFRATGEFVKLVPEAGKFVATEIGSEMRSQLRSMWWR